MNELIEKILEYVEPDDEITPDSLIKTDCGLTSFDMTCILNDLCSETGVDYKSINFAALRTVRDIADVFGIKE